MNTLPVCIYHGRFIASTVRDCPECERNRIINEPARKSLEKIWVVGQFENGRH